MIYLNVNSKLVEQSELTYDDLLVISKQFYIKNKKFPVQLDFNKSNNNLPNWNGVNAILNLFKKTKLDYYKDLGCEDYSLLSYYMTEEQRNLMFFPLTLPSGIIIYYDFSDNPNSTKINWLHCHDQYGYKYYTKRQLMQHCQSKNSIPDKFRFDNPIYLEYNVNNFLQLNNCIYKVYNITNGCKGHDNIQLISKYGDIVSITVNQIERNPFRFTEKGREIALESKQPLGMSKEQAEEILREKISKYDRPLAIKDLKNTGLNEDKHVGRKIVEKYWGTFSNMMYELSGKNGCELTSSGFGINYILENGDFVKSTYEYDFSKMLIAYGFIYGSTYFRNIKYSEICSSYNGRMNCDYMLICGNKTLYIELAGMLNTKNQVDAFLYDKKLDNKIMEKYRQKLILKQNILDASKVNYTIILNPNLNNSYYKQVIDNFINS